MLDALNPEFRAIHYEAPDGPTECVTLLAQDFRSLLFETLDNIPSYGEWLLGCDQGPAYEYHHRALQLLQSLLQLHHLMLQLPPQLPADGGRNTSGQSRLAALRAARIA